MNETLKNYVCEKCGGELKDMGEGRYLCPYCRTEFFKETTLPDELVLDLHSANRERSLQRFEDALNEYDRIISSYPDCFDAYWGATLSDYGIQYEKDYDGRMIPTVHRYSEVPVFENSYYQNAEKYCKNASELMRIENSAAEIERIRAEIKKTVGTQQPYDIFLCYKETPIGGNGGFTSEFYWADELYRRLRGDGYKVFFAKESLPASKGDYEAHIFPALHSSKLMLILTTSVENVESVWVKNEWSRFIRFSRENPSAGKRFKVIQSGFRPENLPRELRKEQVLNHDSMGWVEQLYAVIKDTFRDTEKEAEEKRRREAEELEARIARSSEERIRELERRLEEERNARLLEEQKRLEEEARKRREEENRRNEERIKELERQLAAASAGNAAYTTNSSSPLSTAAASQQTGSSYAAADTDKYEVILSGVAAGKKLDVIKAVKESLGLGLKEAKELVEGAPSTLISDVSGQEADALKDCVEASGGEVKLINLSSQSASSHSITSDAYDVILTKVGTRKLDLIKAFKTTLFLGLVDAKNLAETPNAVIHKGISKKDAEEFKKKYEAVGATVTVVETGSFKSSASGTSANKQSARSTASAAFHTTASYGGASSQAASSSSNVASFSPTASSTPATSYSNAASSSPASSSTPATSYSNVASSSPASSSTSASSPNTAGTVYVEAQLKDGFFKGYAKDGVPVQGTMQYTSGNTYTGPFVNGKRHGKGKFVWKEEKWKGDTYDGDWVEGKKHGKGKYTYASGNTYDGDWTNDTRTGKGVFTYANGETYIGDFVKGRKHGKGKYTYASGNTYNGDWVNDNRTGKGVFTYANGDVYTGDFVENKKHGKGTYTWGEGKWKGDRYEGDWADNERTGYGKYTYASKKVKNGVFFKGVFQNNEPGNTPPSGSVFVNKTFTNGSYSGYALKGAPHGKGIMRYTNGDVYDGEWVNNSRSGKGKYTWANGKTYVGDFLKGQRTGKGICTYASGDVYIGDFVDGKREGTGMYKYPNGNSYIGDWTDDDRTGKGIFTYASANDVYIGDFVKNKRHGKGKYIWGGGKNKGDTYDGDWFEGDRTGYGKYVYANGTVQEGRYEKGVFKK